MKKQKCIKNRGRKVRKQCEKKGKNGRKKERIEDAGKKKKVNKEKKKKEMKR